MELEYISFEMKIWINLARLPRPLLVNTWFLHARVDTDK